MEGHRELKRHDATVGPTVVVEPHERAAAPADTTTHADPPWAYAALPGPAATPGNRTTTGSRSLIRTMVGRTYRPSTRLTS